MTTVSGTVACIGCGAIVPDTAAIQQAAGRKAAYRWLEPPASLGPVTVLDLCGIEAPSEYAQRVEQWARSVWAVWAPHHATVRQWALVGSRSS